MNLINGKLRSLNRKNQKITYESIEGEIYNNEYDILILCSGLVEKSLSTILKKEKVEFKLNKLISISDLNKNLKLITN